MSCMVDIGLSGRHKGELESRHLISISNLHALIEFEHAKIVRITRGQEKYEFDLMMVLICHSVIGNEKDRDATQTGEGKPK